MTFECIQTILTHYLIQFSEFLSLEIYLDFNSLEVFCEGSSIGSLGSVLDGRVLGGSGLLSGTFSTAI